MHKKPEKNGRVSVFVILFFALFVWAAWKICPQQLRVMQEMLIPKDAIHSLLQNLQEGEDIIQAIGAFCQEILDAV